MKPKLSVKATDTFVLPDPKLIKAGPDSTFNIKPDPVKKVVQARMLFTDH